MELPAGFLRGLSSDWRRLEGSGFRATAGTGMELMLRGGEHPPQHGSGLAGTQESGSKWSVALRLFSCHLRFGIKPVLHGPVIGAAFPQVIEVSQLLQLLDVMPFASVLL